MQGALAPRLNSSNSCLLPHCGPETLKVASGPPTFDLPTARITTITASSPRRHETQRCFGGQG